MHEGADLEFGFYPPGDISVATIGVAHVEHAIVLNEDFPKKIFTEVS